MRVLLDTNIIIHRENTNSVSNYSIGHLYRWIDRLGWEKVIHPLSVEEILRYDKDPATLELLKVKLNSYETLHTVDEIPSSFVDALAAFNNQGRNNIVDNHLLYEVFIGHVDYLITEDKALRKKGEALGLGGKVLSINQVISMVTARHPDLTEYQVLNVRKEYFGRINLQDPFFDSFRDSYPGFDAWFNGKCNEQAYICDDQDGNLVGFLYLKVEGPEENYGDIIPLMAPKKRLKIGTFKIESTGYRLGERFIKIVFDNAVKFDVEEVYVTMFSEKSDVAPLCDLLERWGFKYFGKKNGDESVYVKELSSFDSTKTPKENFPIVRYEGVQKFFLPILSKYHTSLFPDSILNTEDPEDFLSNVPHRYALQKVYISFSFERNINPGDLVYVYRMGDTNKRYTSCLTTLCVIEDVHYDFPTKQAFFDCCENRSVFSKDELESFWKDYSQKILVVKLIVIRELKTRLILNDLWNMGIIETGSGPRPFTRLSNEQFAQILEASNTPIRFGRNGLMK